MEPNDRGVVGGAIIAAPTVAGVSPFARPIFRVVRRFPLRTALKRAVRRCGSADEKQRSETYGDDARIADLDVVVQGDEHAELGVVRALFEERAQSVRVLMRVDALPVLHFQRDAARADGEHEIDFGFRSPRGEVVEIEPRNSTEIGADDAFRDVAREVGRVRGRRQSGRGQRDGLVDPTGAQRVVDQAELGVALRLLKADLQRPYESDEERGVQESEVAAEALRADVARQSLRDFFQQQPRTGGLACVAADELEDELQQVFVALAPLRRVRQLVELDAEDPPRVDAFFAQQVFDDLLLQRRLPDLSRPLEDDARGQVPVQPLQEGLERPTAERRQRGLGAIRPPRVRPPEELLLCGRDSAVDEKAGNVRRQGARLRPPVREGPVGAAADRSKNEATPPVGRGRFQAREIGRASCRERVCARV